MTHQSRTADFRHRIHQGHVNNFIRRIKSAENPAALDSIMDSIRDALARHIVDPRTGGALEEALGRRRQTLESRNDLQANSDP